MTRFRPVTPAVLVETVAARLGAPTTRVAIDGPPCAEPEALAAELVAAVRVSRPVAHVRAETFWRDASLRFEFGREDVTSYLGWLDREALDREVLRPVMAGRYLPSLRDPVSNRSTREPPRSAPPGTVLVVSGSFLLGHDLPFDLTVHLAVSPGARTRLTPDTEAWTLAAFDEYDRTVRPAETADLAVRYDDPQHPALRLT